MSIAIIGGSGLDQLECFNSGQKVVQTTPYGKHSDSILQASLSMLLDHSSGESTSVFFLPRHGSDHSLPPHKVNYRANLWALKSLGVNSIVACNVVGGITEQMAPKTLVIPDQVIDYTWGREHTFFDGLQGNDLVRVGVEHIDFSYPYSLTLRKKMITFFDESKIPYVDGAVYGCTQGPRLESAAEISRLKNDGCDIVGMTSMPEAALARELGIDYVSLSVVVNWGAGVTTEELSMDEISKTISSSMQSACQFMPALMSFLR